jgi:MerR family transcriptional regulator, copper efflux regulator
MDDSRLLIGDLAELAGVAPSALRYYESAGLLPAETRTESGYRVYGSQAALRLGFIQRAKKLGFKLPEIKRLIDAPCATREGELTYFERVLASKISETRERIAGLRATEQQLRRLEATLQTQPPYEACHLGDCACWMPA